MRPSHPCPWEPFQDPAVLAVLAGQYRWKLAELGGLPGLERRLPLFGSVWSRIWSPEWSDPLGWVERIPGAETGLVDVMTSEHVVHSAYRPMSPPDLFSSIVLLDPDPDRMLRSFEQRTRKAIGRAQRGGLAVTRASNGPDVDAFLSFLHGFSMGGTRFDVPPAPIIHALLAADLARLYVARWRGTLGGGLVLLGRGTMSHGLVAGYDPALCDGLPGSLLYWEAMCAESGRGAQFLDLGAQRDADLPTLALAKRAWRPIRQPAYRYQVIAGRYRAGLARGLDRIRRRSD